jgi:broad specificity phosphatase PhoE
MEPKAISTASIIASELKIPLIKKLNLHEHDRTGVKLFSSKETFRKKIKEMFDKPDVLVFGKETANEACKRFLESTTKIAEANEGTCVIVSHGTIMTLYTKYYNKIKPMEFWEQLTLPCLVVLEKNSKKFIKIVSIS